MEEIVIRPLTHPAEECAPLVHASEAEGHAFVRRLVDEDVSGANRFDRPGEALFGAFHGAALVGVCGLNHDPYRGDTPRAGRLRHLYVLPAYRRRGVGRRLVRAVIATARPAFDDLTLWTNNPEAAALYQTLGFVAAQAIPKATHILVQARVDEHDG